MSDGKIIDPVCDTIVGTDDARDAGLTLEYPDREYAFCAPGCQTKFAKEPKAFIPKVEAWPMRYAHTFTQMGSYRYLCIPHHGDGMYGEVVVVSRTQECARRQAPPEARA